MHLQSFTFLRTFSPHLIKEKPAPAQSRIPKKVHTGCCSVSAQVGVSEESFFTEICKVSQSISCCLTQNPNKEDDARFFYSFEQSPLKYKGTDRSPRHLVLFVGARGPKVQRFLPCGGKAGGTAGAASGSTPTFGRMLFNHNKMTSCRILPSKK